MYRLQYSLAPEMTSRVQASAGQKFRTAATRTLTTLFKHKLGHKHTLSNSDVEACLVMKTHSYK